MKLIDKINKGIATSIILLVLSAGLNAQTVVLPKSIINITASGTSYPTNKPLPVVPNSGGTTPTYTISSSPANTQHYSVFPISIPSTTVGGVTTQSAVLNWTKGTNTFTITFLPNTRQAQSAVIRIVDQSTGEFADFIFTQSGGAPTYCGAWLSTTHTAASWKVFDCYNLGSDRTLDPFTPAAGLGGSKYMWGGYLPAITMADDQNHIYDTNPGSTFVVGQNNAATINLTGEHNSSTSSGQTWGAFQATWVDYQSSLLTPPADAYFDGQQGSQYIQPIASGGVHGGASSTVAWMLTTTRHNPCPAGYTVTTNAIWTQIFTALGWPVSSGSYTPPASAFIGTWSANVTNFSSGLMIGANLFLPAAGFRNTLASLYNTQALAATLVNRGLIGKYWNADAATVATDYGASASAFIFNENSAGLMTGGELRTDGLSIRCMSSY